MSDKPTINVQRVFMTGNEVIAWAAIAAGADIMYGYPITPQNEVMHYWTRMAPRFGRKFLQTEDELSAGFATLGGILAGSRAFSATAGPGTTLFQEPISMAEMMRIPIVMAIMQRGGPSTATVIYSQQEVNMVTYGGNGEGWRVVYSTATHQELYDYMIKSFNTAWKYRFPAFVLADGYQAKMREPLVMYNPEDHGVAMVEPQAFVGHAGIPGIDRPPVHLRNTFSVEEELYHTTMPIQEDFEKMSAEIVEWDEQNCDDAELVLITHGVVSRAAYAAMNKLREKGYKVGYFRPITLRPFPQQKLQAVAAKCSHFLLAESALGQLARLVKEALFNIPVKRFDTLYKPGVGFTAEELVRTVESMQKEEGERIHG